MVIGMAPPKQGTPIQIRVPDDLLMRIDQRAQRRGVSRAETIRRMLAWADAQPISKEPR